MPSLDKSPGETLNFTGLPGSCPIRVPVEQDFPLMATSWFLCRRPIQMILPEGEIAAGGADAVRVDVGVTTGLAAAACAGTMAGCAGGGAGFSAGGLKV